jgi:hypothetical protein
MMEGLLLTSAERIATALTKLGSFRQKTPHPFVVPELLLQAFPHRARAGGASELMQRSPASGVGITFITVE